MSRDKELDAAILRYHFVEHWGVNTIAAQLALSYEIPFVRLTNFPSSWRRGSSPIKTLALLPFASRARRARRPRT